MRSVSGRWEDGIASSQALAVEVTLLGSDELLPVISGSVTLDITAETRGRCDLTFADPDLIPVDSSSLLAPYSNELQVKRGLVYPDGSRELVSLGIFRIEETEIEDGEGVQIKVAGLDRSARVIDAKFEEPYSIAGGTDYLTAIENGIKQVFGDVETDFAEADFDTPTLKAEEGDDRWAFFQTMAAAIGMDLYFDNDGVLVLRPIATPGANPVAEIVEGSDGVEVLPSLLSASKKWTRTEAHNRWIVTGDNPDTEGAPPRAVATDEDPESPTYYYGPFGPKPDFHSSSFVSTTAQATDAANGRKAKEIGTTQSVDFGAIVNPALEPSDVVQITRTRPSRSNPAESIAVVDERHILDQLTIPLGASESMTGTTRSQRVAA